VLEFAVFNQVAEEAFELVKVFCAPCDHIKQVAAHPQVSVQ
jgi:hypothetical protein